MKRGHNIISESLSNLRDNAAVRNASMHGQLNQLREELVEAHTNAGVMLVRMSEFAHHETILLGRIVHAQVDTLDLGLAVEALEDQTTDKVQELIGSLMHCAMPLRSMRQEMQACRATLMLWVSHCKSWALTLLTTRYKPGQRVLLARKVIRFSMLQSAVNSTHCKRDTVIMWRRMQGYTHTPMMLARYYRHWATMSSTTSNIMLVWAKIDKPNTSIGISIWKDS